MPKRYLEAAVAAAEVSISITYGEQQNRQTTQVQVNQAQASQIQAGGKTTLIAGGAGEQSNINITGSDVSGKAGTGLIADNDITLQSHRHTIVRWWYGRIASEKSGYQHLR